MSHEFVLILCPSASPSPRIMFRVGPTCEGCLKLAAKLVGHATFRVFIGFYIFCTRGIFLTVHLCIEIPCCFDTNICHPNLMSPTWVWHSDTPKIAWAFSGPSKKWPRHIDSLMLVMWESVIGWVWYERITFKWKNGASNSEPRPSAVDSWMSHRITCHITGGPGSSAYPRNITLKKYVYQY